MAGKSSAGAGAPVAVSGPMPAPGDRLSLASKVFYGSGDIFGGGAMVIIGFFFLFFMTEVAHLEPALAGLVLLVGKVWDAINDPLMGYLSDRTRSRFGRRRVYFLAGALPIVVTFTLLWVVPPASSQWALFAYFALISILFDTVLTMVMVPYSALMQEMTTDYNERSSLTGWRMAFSNLSSLVAAVVPTIIVGAFAEATTGYRMMGLAFGLFFALPWLGVFAFTTERRREEAVTRFNLLTDARDTLMNRSFRSLIGVYLLTYLALDIVSAVIMYFMTYVVGRPGDVSIVLGLLLVLQLGALPLFVYLAKKHGKRTAFFVGAAAWVALLPWLFLIGSSTPPWVIYVLAALLGVATSGAGFAPWAMFPDVLDVDEVVTGRRRQGVYSGVMTFLRKVSSALALFIVGWAIGASGYVAGESRQTADFLLTVRILVAFAPLIPVAVALLCARGFPITPAVHEALRAEFAALTAEAADGKVAGAASTAAGMGAAGAGTAGAGVAATLYGKTRKAGYT